MGQVTPLPANPIHDREMPHNSEAETAVLGWLLGDKQAIYRVRSILSEDDFWSDQNRPIYAAVAALCDEGVPADYVSIVSRLKANGTYEDVGGKGYLLDIALYSASGGDLEHNAELVAEAAYRRRMIGLAAKVTKIAYDGTVPLEKVRQKTWSLLTALETRRRRNRPLSAAEQTQLFREMTADIENDVSRAVPTGIVDFDRITDGGLEPGQLAVLMALPSMGKSAVGQGIGRHMGTHERHVLFCSVEMTEKQLVRRNAASFLNMDWHVFKRRWRHWREEPDRGKALLAAYERAEKQMAASGMRVWYMPAMTTADIRIEAMEMQAQEGLDCVIVDYLQILADGEGEKLSRNDQVGRTCRALKRIAGELDVPVFCLSQMNRDYKDRENKRPQMSDARDSGEIEQHVDMLMGLYRDDFFYKGEGAVNEKKQPVVPGAAEILVLKQRDGPTATCHVQWVPELCQYMSAGDVQGRPL